MAIVSLHPFPSLQSNQVRNCTYGDGKRLIDLMLPTITIEHSSSRRAVTLAPMRTDVLRSSRINFQSSENLKAWI